MIEEQIAKAESSFMDNNISAADVIIMRPEIRAALIEELGMSWDEDLNSYMGLSVAVSTDPNFPDFKLAKF